MAAEHAHARLKGFVASFPQMGVPVGLILASLIFTAVAGRSFSSGNASAAFLSFGWRIPFLLSAILVAVGLIVRLSIPETPAFERCRRREEVMAAPVRSVLSKNLKPGPLAAMPSEMFPSNVRYSGVSVGYQGAAIFAGGLAPFVATLLLHWSGGASWVLAAYLIFMAAISLVSICLIPETSGVDLTEAAPLPVLEYAG